ncbi:hypothetical protein GCM10011351_12680 [Paraliobacillus quinghaiensis]|uniref:Uncharacterized protein n=1 Tax=Paraliobacillus quinghaiensis TaxID=470815 RepID=A0A917TLR7_9BACI|nr:hypothetical protein [Paraliobacillus quinghaiensis]GGM28243.1 hypothetical protein GCM10011351_12680 [Paraliobacillus quinghaiensis]
MNHTLVQILLKAKEVNKWIPVKFLIKYDIQQVNLLKLEDAYLIIMKNSTSEGLLLKLTLRGYHYFNKKLD